MAMPQHDPSICPVCKSTLTHPLNRVGGEAHDLDCPHCGRLTVTAHSLVDLHAERDDFRRQLLSHTVRQMQVGDSRPYLDSATVSRILETRTLPTPKQQADNLVLLLGQSLANRQGEVLSLTFVD